VYARKKKNKQKTVRNLYTTVPWNEKPSPSATWAQYADIYFCSILKNRTAKYRNTNRYGHIFLLLKIFYIYLLKYL